MLPQVSNDFCSVWISHALRNLPLYSQLKWKYAAIYFTIMRHCSIYLFSSIWATAEEQYVNPVRFKKRTWSVYLF